MARTYNIGQTVSWMVFSPVEMECGVFSGKVAEIGSPVTESLKPGEYLVETDYGQKFVAHEFRGNLVCGSAAPVETPPQEPGLPYPGDIIAKAPAPAPAVENTSDEAPKQNPPNLVPWGIIYNGPASHQAVEILAEIFGKAAVDVGHAIIDPTHTMYCFQTDDAATPIQSLEKKFTSAKETRPWIRDLFESEMVEPMPEQLAEAERSVAPRALAVLTA